MRLLVPIIGKTPQGEDSKLDIEKLRMLCVSKHGLVNSEIRKIVWPILLNAESFQIKNEKLS